MRAERPTYDRGWLLVLSTDFELLVRRQGFENVLYVGAETVERVNVGAGSGYLVAVLPGDVDLAAQPIFFGDPELPERITAEAAAEQLEKALDSGVAAVGAEALAEALHPRVTALDAKDLQVFASYLIEEYASDEVDLVRGIRAPRLEAR